MNKVIHSDVINWLHKRNVIKRKFNLIIADPPFNINFGEEKGNYNRDEQKVLRGYIESPKNYEKFIGRFLIGAKWHLAENGTIYLFAGWNWLDKVIQAMRKADLFYRNHLIWKYQFGVFCKKRFVTSHYHIIVITKNDNPYWNKKEGHYVEDVLDIKRPYRKGKAKTPTMLPEELIGKLIAISSKKGDYVLDAFAGSGRTSVMCKKMGRTSIAVELSETYCDFIKKEVS